MHTVAFFSSRRTSRHDRRTLCPTTTTPVARRYHTVAAPLTINELSVDAVPITLFRDDADPLTSIEAPGDPAADNSPRFLFQTVYPALQLECKFDGQGTVGLRGRVGCGPPPHCLSVL